MTLAGTLERYRNAAHARNIATTVAQIGATTHGNVSVSFSSGSQYLRVPDGRFRPFDQQGIGIGYLDGTATPVDAFYSAGRYADGFLRSWVRRAVVKPTTRSSLIAEFDDQRYRPDGSGVRTQYLQRVAYEEQFPGDSSAVIGIFRTAGIARPRSERRRSRRPAATRSISTRVLPPRPPRRSVCDDRLTRACSRRRRRCCSNTSIISVPSAERDRARGRRRSFPRSSSLLRRRRSPMLRS